MRVTKPRMMVVAGVLEQDGRVLIGQRKRNDKHPLKWEFPGGKVEAGERPTDALRRELREELAIEATIGAEVSRYEVQYARRPPILLIFYRVSQWTGEPQSAEFEQICWEAPERLPSYDFLDGDLDFVRRLARGMV